MQVIERFIKAKPNIKDFYIAFFLASACILSYIEGFIPKPLPGIKLGLANSIVLVFIVYSLYKIAIFISMGKVLIVSLFAGYIMTPTFLLGLSGSFLSVIAMITLHAVLKQKVSALGLSVAGAFFHVTAQLITAYFILPSIKSGILWLSGILLLTSFLSGILTGLFALYLLKNL